MLIIFLKSAQPDAEREIPMPEKLRLIFKERIKDATTDEDRERAKADLENLGTISS